MAKTSQDPPVTSIPVLPYASAAADRREKYLDWWLLPVFVVYVIVNILVFRLCSPTEFFKTMPLFTVCFPPILILGVITAQFIRKRRAFRWMSVLVFVLGMIGAAAVNLILIAEVGASI